MSALSFSIENILAVHVATIQCFGGLSVFMHRFSAKQNSCSWFMTQPHTLTRLQTASVRVGHRINGIRYLQGRRRCGDTKEPGRVGFRGLPPQSYRH